ncbi:MAG: VWA domain-containing protein [Chromatiales bacterium]|nr:MAG: VWA domain-containing protein [Chromatiales bacterium]
MNDPIYRRGLAPAVFICLALAIGACTVREDPPEAAGTGGTPPTPGPKDITQQEIPPVSAVPEEVKNSPATVEADAIAGRHRADQARPAMKMHMEMAPGVASAYGVPEPWRIAREPLDRENYAHLDPNPVRLVSADPVSTFSIDVDTGGYANVRRMLNEGRLPPEDAVRIEELINYFDYAYPVPADSRRPFSITTELAAAPWNADRLLLQIGIKGYEVPAEQRPPANLVFLIDVSGSMNDPRKLPLLKQSMKLLARQLTADDCVSMVVYAGAAGVVLEPTPGDEQAKILAALDRLQAGGSTNGAGGIRAAYQLARQAYLVDGINRILLATDGDLNVGTVDFDSLIDLVEREREGGVSLTTLGFGTGNYNDHLTEQLADAGNGNYAYIDNLNEGRKVLVDQVGSTLQTIAKDVKIQVEFNPAVVAEYRLIGYENRMLRREDFNNDKIDAGEIGAGHTVTALYELTLVDSPARLMDPLRYGSEDRRAQSAAGEAAFVRLRYKAPDGDVSQLIEQPVRTRNVDANPSAELRFAAAVAAFGQLLRGGDYLGDYQYTDVLALAGQSKGADPHGYRGEFVGLVRLADSLATVNAPDRQARR